MRELKFGINLIEILSNTLVFHLDKIKKVLYYVNISLTQLTNNHRETHEELGNKLNSKQTCRCNFILWKIYGQLQITLPQLQTFKNSKIKI